MFYLEIEAWGDFDMKYTYAVMSSESHTKESIKPLMIMFADKHKLTSNHEDGLIIDKSGISSVKDDYKYPDQLVSFLKKQGFRFITTSKISVSD